MRVFLSGAVEGLSGDYNNWRKTARTALKDAGFVVVSPVQWASEDRTVNQIVHSNEALQKKCDITLVEYMIPHRAYIGVDYEIVRARDWGQPVIVWANEMYRERVYLRYLATAIMPTLEECLDFIQANYPVIK